ncbi:alpha/beta hydrolase [Nocardia otitidiscaviarum]|uniref:alpha/beta hydrolase family protein n=1 Tax=Nocardia otitidiscaviarum TaxID=1823 RepID=UPI0004A782C8|nr:alpha/beta hydrolase [Nocardia otitidiscaviarum]MBF6485844.1 alpha/beta hydrolase [Nocardia otitidiscaviarum]
MRSPKSLLLVLLAIVALVAAGCGKDDATPTPEQVSGDWHGSIELPGRQLAIGVNFANDGEATVDIPEQGVAAAPLTGVSADPDKVTFSIPDVPGDPKFEGTHNRDSDTIEGEFSQGGQQFPLRLTRGQVEGPARPQEPRAPFPYDTEEVSYPSGEITVAGTLTRPEGTGPFPTVVLITGSGPQDRDETLLGHKPFLLLADTLTRAGYAVLRTDDRGVGGTGGNLEHATYQELTDDIIAGMNYLRGRDDIDDRRIGLLGHSEGGYLAPLAAARPDSGVAFTILLAGPAVPGSEVLLEQNRLIMAAQGATPEEISEQIGFVSGLVAIVRTGDLEAARRYVLEHNESLPEDERSPEEAAAQMASPYMAALLNYDPAPALSALRVPTLAVYGGKDLQVPPAQSEGPMRNLLADNPDATVHTFDGLNHLLQPADKGTPDEYAAIETTMDPAVLDYLSKWLTERMPPR